MERASGKARDQFMGPGDAKQCAVDWSSAILCLPSFPQEKIAIDWGSIPHLGEISSVLDPLCVA